MDAELLADIASARGDTADLAAREAFGEFYQRHAGWLYQRLFRTSSFGLLKPMDAVHDVVQETFYRAFKGAKTFDPNFVTDPRRSEALVRGWLGGIANRVIADMLRHPQPDTVEPTRLEPRQTAWADATDEATPDSPVVTALQHELKRLSPLQQDIIAAAEFYYQPDATYQRLPNGVTKRLAEKHGTSSDNIRQVRRRTMASLRKKLQPLLEEK
jgi:RNA polymerase sigma factor (sigma-70 family)